MLEQHPLGDDPARVPRQVDQQLELARDQPEVAAGPARGPLDEVDLERADRDPRWPPVAAAPAERAHPSASLTSVMPGHLLPSQTREPRL